MGGMGGIQKSEAVAKEHAMEGLMIPALPGSSSSIGTMSVHREEARTGRGGKINLISNYAKKLHN